MTAVIKVAHSVEPDVRYNWVGDVVDLVPGASVTLTYPPGYGAKALEALRRLVETAERDVAEAP